GSSRRRPSSCMNAYSRGSGAPPERNMSTSLPSWRRATVVASSDPSASTSGFSWFTTRKRSCSRNAAAIAWRSVDVCVILGCELVDQLAHPHAALDGRIALEGQLRGAPPPTLAHKLRLQRAVGGLEPPERRLLLLLRAEDAHEDDRVAKVGCRVDTRHRHEADP